MTQNRETRVATAIGRKRGRRPTIHLVTKQKVLEESEIATFNDQEQ